MKYLADVVRECVQGDDLRAVEAAVAKSSEALFDDVRRVYGRLKLRPPARKRQGEFVPGWRLDVDDLSEPYGRDPYFVVRAILYSHRVALSDPLYFYAHPLTNLGIPPHTLKEDLHKILFFAPLEEAGLLIYLNPVAAGLPRAIEPPHVSRGDVDSYFRDYLAPRGIYRPVADEEWSADVGPAWAARVAAELELMHGLPAVADLLDWQRHYRDIVDLYVPDIPLFHDPFEWLMRKTGRDVFGCIEERDNATLSALWALPTPTADEYRFLTIKDLLFIRQETAFAKWRSALQYSASSFFAAAAMGNASDGLKEFISVLDDERQRVMTTFDRVRAPRTLTGRLGGFGMSVAVAAASADVATQFFPDENPSAVAAATAASLAAPYAVRLPRAVRTALSRRTANRALERHFDLFATTQ